VLDPPRGGAEAVAAALARLRPPRVVYVSCDPPALARDVGVLVRDGGYRLAAAGIADMFPHTGHVEALACLDAPGPGAAPRTP
jgi:23S rRNA (uracil1939-C5)-methyltransferase